MGAGGCNAPRPPGEVELSVSLDTEEDQAGKAYDRAQQIVDRDRCEEVGTAVRQEGVDTRTS